MDIITALKISASGVLVVFLALGLIWIAIKILSVVISAFDKPKTQENEISEVSIVTKTNIIDDKDAIGYGELKLFGVDERTAAMVMAIVSDESKISLAELRFGSIKLLEN